MSRRKETETPAAAGERWRVLMSDGRENLASLVWRRIWVKFKVDLSDPKQATGEQIHRLLKGLMDDYEETGVMQVTPLDLEAVVDSQVPKLFPKPI